MTKPFTLYTTKLTRRSYIQSFNYLSSCPSALEVLNVRIYFIDKYKISNTKLAYFLTVMRASHNFQYTNSTKCKKKKKNPLYWNSSNLKHKGTYIHIYIWKICYWTAKVYLFSVQHIQNSLVIAKWESIFILAVQQLNRSISLWYKDKSKLKLPTFENKRINLEHTSGNTSICRALTEPKEYSVQNIFIGVGSFRNLSLTGKFWEWHS